MPHSDVDDSASCAPSFTTDASDGAHGQRRGAKKYKWHKRFAYQKFAGWRPILTPRIAGAPPPPPPPARALPPAASFRGARLSALPRWPRCRAVLHSSWSAAAGAGHPCAHRLAQRGGGGCSPPAAACMTARALPCAGPPSAAAPLSLLIVLTKVAAN